MLAFLNPYKVTGRPLNKTLNGTTGEIPCVPMEANLATVQRAVSHGTFGRVSFQGVSWRAKCLQNITCSPGASVKVLYRQGNTLMIDALQPSKSRNAA